MRTYLNLLADVLAHGTLKEQRAVTLDGVPLRTRAVFGRQCRYNLSEGFPLVTTKRIPFRLIVAELLWFLSGSTNNRDLQARGCTIWNEWADPETGELGPIYGRQWRRWPTADDETVDQIALLVQNIKAVRDNPRHSAGRRLILTAWNPGEMHLCSGPMACHTFSQYDVTEGKLTCQLYQRSADLFLGVPFNIACYALLTHLLAEVAGLDVGEFIHTFGDAHIYENHFDQVREQISRSPLPLPKLRFTRRLTSIDDVKPEDIVLQDYVSHPTLKGEVAV
jgi:thymidylate synthase